MVRPKSSYELKISKCDTHSFTPFQASRVWVQNKVDESKHEIHSQVDAITAGTASVVNLTSDVCPGEHRTN